MGTDDKNDDLTNNALLTVAVIEDHYEQTQKTRDKIDCPVCEQTGTLSYSRGPKSLWVKCATPGCMKFHADFK